MARYHFNLHDGSALLDEEGFEFADFDQVRSQAIQFLGSSLVDSSQRVFKDQNWRLDVTNDTGDVLLSVHLFAIDAMGSRQSPAPHCLPLDQAAAA